MRRLAPARITDSVYPDAVWRTSSSSMSTLRGLRKRVGLSGRYLTGLVAFSALLCGGTHEALAQFGPGGGLRPGSGNPGGFGGPQGNAPSDKPEGPAEAAPVTGPADTATEPLPQWPEEKKDKALQFLQVHGYLRGRGYFWSNFNLGSYNDPTLRANPFTVPFSELPDSSGNRPLTGCSGRNNNNGCVSKDVRTADMRFRLEPTMNLSEHIRIKAQVDIFDNLVLGSTPEGWYINGHGGTSDGYPRIFSRGQVTPENLVNTLGSSIRAKRAWGEIRIPLLEINFGRMPLVWGTGMLFHDGNCNDCDFGTTVDRIMLTLRMWNHFASISWDWAASGPTSALVTNQSLTGWNYNIDNVAEVLQWTLAIGRRDSDEFIADALRHNKPVINYGLFALARYQDYDLTFNPRPQVTLPNTPVQDVPELYPVKELQKLLERRAAWAVTLDLWSRLQYKKLYLEAEGATTFGDIGNIGVYGDSTATTAQRATMQILQLGGLVRGHYKFLRDSLTVGLEVGSATGPQNGDPTGELNWRRAREKPGLPSAADGLIHMNASRFTFDPDYHVDMILFRRILGTVYNATYLKPAVTYWLIDSFGGQAEFIYSLANRPAVFPGHSINMGAEINARLMYQNKQEGFNVVLEYGVLFDLGALSQNATDTKTGQPVWTHVIPIDGTTAQAFQAKIQLKF